MELYFPLFLDGATGTQLQKRGFANDQAAETWVLNHPEALKDTQKSYIEAGSQIIYASTFGANRIKLEEHGIVDQVADYNKRLVAISKEVAGEKALVAGDIAPTGKFMIPMGNLTFEEIYDVYLEQAKALEEAGVDLFVVETMMSIEDARAAVLAVKSISDKPVFVTFTCDENGKSLTGADVCAALVILQGMGIQAFGLNCSFGPDVMLEQLKRLGEYAEIPLIVKPNAGVPELIDGKTVFQSKPEEFGKYAPEFAKAGVQIFGGCCGTEAEHIAQLVSHVCATDLKKPIPMHAGELPASTPKQPAYLQANVSNGSVLIPDASLGDKIEDAMENEKPLLTIALRDLNDYEVFAENHYLISKPLCIQTDDAALLEKALRIYQGRALYDGNITEDVLIGLQKKYGMIY